MIFKFMIHEWGVEYDAFFCRGLSVTSDFEKFIAHPFIGKHAPDWIDVVGDLHKALADDPGIYEKMDELWGDVKWNFYGNHDEYVHRHGFPMPEQETYL